MPLSGIVAVYIVWFLKIILFNLFIFGCIGSLLLHAGFLQLRGLLFVVVRGLLIVVASLVAEHRL